MKKVIALVLALACVFSLAGCVNNKEKIWEWTQGLKKEDIICATPKRQDGEFLVLEPLNDAQTLELVALLNNLTKESFTENKKLTGGTPTFSIEIVMDSETYHLNEANGPYGALEISYNEKLWWIDNPELSAFVEAVTGSASAE